MNPSAVETFFLEKLSLFQERADIFRCGIGA